MALLLKHQTQQEFVQRFRQAYQEATQERVVQLAKFVLNKITAGDLTDTQVRNAFNLTVNQWNTLKTKMQTWVANYESFQSAAGE